MTNKHPNATTAGGAGGLALLVVWILGYFGITDIGAEEAVVATGLLTSAALLIGRKGLKGILRGLWIGNGK